MKNKTQLKLFLEGENYKIYEYQPRFSCLFFYEMEKLNWRKRARFLGELIKKGGYKVYYFYISDNLVGYCVVSTGGGRYFFAKENEYLVGPYYIDPKYRGNRYSEFMVSKILESEKYRHSTFYAWIDKNNVPSIRCIERLCFKKRISIDIKGFTRRMRLRENFDGQFIVYKYENELLS